MTSNSGDWLPLPTWGVLRAKCFTPVQGRVLFALWSRCNRGGVCWPGLETIAEDCGCDQRSVKTAVATLEHHGVIRVERAAGVANHYHLDPDHITRFIEEHTTPLKNVGGTKLTPLKIVGTTPYKNAGGTPLKIVGGPPTKMYPEEDPIEEDPFKKIHEDKTYAAAEPEPEPEQEPETLAEPVRKFLAVLQGQPGFSPTPAFIGKVAAKYAHLDLEEEAIRMVGWLDAYREENPKKKPRLCRVAFVLNWLGRDKFEGRGNTSNGRTRTTVATAPRPRSTEFADAGFGGRPSDAPRRSVREEFAEWARGS